jgi:uncharacterized protein
MIKLEKMQPSIMLKIPEIRTALSEDANVIFAYLFGGLAKGEVKPLSDIDIAVYINDSVSITGRILLNKQILADKNILIRYIYESVTLREFFDFRIKEKSLLTSRCGIG